MTDLADSTATELIELYSTKQASPVEATSACLERIEATDGPINAILLLLEEAALEQAAESERRWSQGTARPMEGVPYGLKDIIATSGVGTTGGSALYRDWVPSRGAVLADRLAGAGGVLLAKLQTFEFACGGATNKTFGPVHNPWDLSRTTGGSSSGSGAAVAAGMVPVAIGTDTGGSIRIPAAYCGITGLKPTHGRVPRTGVMGLSWTLDHAGPMTRSVWDCALTLEAIAGHDPSDPTSSSRLVPAYGRALKGAEGSAAGLRIGRPNGYLLEMMHPDVSAAFERSLEALADAGATIVDVELPTIHMAEAAGWMIMYAEMFALHEGHISGIDDRDDMGAGILARTPFVSAADYLRALRLRVVVQREMEEVFQNVDALATPGATTIAPHLDDMLVDTGTEFLDWLAVATRTSLPFNFTGQPGLCMPMGTVEGLPVSLQLVGRPHDEQTLFDLGAAFQSCTDHHLAQPSILTAAV
jgi:aspartyl-tRNA(Asn)/glutamyl-tRNA(Gln) amidotransferase subunit A